jgi:hypothetical protein
LLLPFELIGTDGFHDGFDSNECSCLEFRQRRLREAESEKGRRQVIPFLFAVFKKIESVLELMILAQL